MACIWRAMRVNRSVHPLTKIPGYAPVIVGAVDVKQNGSS